MKKLLTTLLVMLWALSTAGLEPVPAWSAQAKSEKAMNQAAPYKPAPPVYQPAFKTVTLDNGLTMRYAQMGPAKGPVVVMVHGATDSYISYSQLAPSLAAAGYNVYVPELRGHGGTGKPQEGPYTVALHQEDISGFMAELGLARAWLVGHSLGGLISQEMAIKAPEKVAGLTLMGTGPKTANLQWLLTGDGDKFPGVLSFKDKMPDDFVADWAGTTNYDPEFKAKTLEHAKSLPMSTWVNTFKGLEKVDLSPGLGKVDVPVQIIWGGADTLFSRQDQMDLITGLTSSPNIDFITKAGASHNVHWDGRLAEEIGRDILQFMAMAGY